MVRLLPVAAVLAFIPTSAADAQSTGGPPIAFVKVGGTSMEIDLANTDGTGLRKVYTGGRKQSIGLIDLKPGGNEVALSEGFKIKIQKYSDGGQPVGSAINVPSSCNAWSPDYHPSGDGTLIFVNGCSAGNMQVMRYSPVTGQAVPLFSVIIANRVRWSQAGDYIYYDEAASATALDEHLKRRNVATGQVDDFGILTDLDSFDIIRGSGERLVFGPEAAPKVFDFGTMTDTSQATPVCVAGSAFHYSPDGTRFIYRTPHNARGDYILIRNADCSGGSNAITGKGSWGQTDWRP